MTNRSNTYKIIDRIVPPLLVPKCGNGYHHVSNLSMGQKFPGELGQRSWFCRGPQAVRCKGETKPMDRQTWKEVKEAISGLDKKTGPIDTGDAETCSVTVVVFITAHMHHMPIASFVN
ncbi:hypothetical protein K443DRAFT_126341 [Laccaria amethystina LaAM-08-1]|uniref:Uncharacterized protein n=1 Tax=Laccaria amethystina LaAM-08-1 TaxID=1095629 RepID=A0A0C9X3E6_9AGAR|nr:hypothetical protein K443DRAFT_126341 [Laccaria amethystina LaAM-08-1]